MDSTVILKRVCECPIHCVHRNTYRKSFSPHLLVQFPKNHIFQEYIPNLHPLLECFYYVIIHPIQPPIPILFKASSEIQGGWRKKTGCLMRSSPYYEITELLSLSVILFPYFFLNLLCFPYSIVFIYKRICCVQNFQIRQSFHHYHILYFFSITRDYFAV